MVGLIEQKIASDGMVVVVDVVVGGVVVVDVVVGGVIAVVVDLFFSRPGHEVIKIDTSSHQHH